MEEEREDSIVFLNGENGRQKLNAAYTDPEDDDIDCSDMIHLQYVVYFI